MKVILSTLSLLAVANSQLTSTQKNTILNDHNALRQRTENGQTLCANDQNCPAAQSIPDLVWDDELAQLAQEYADGCPGGHSDRDWRLQRFQTLKGDNSLGRPGENMAWGHSVSGVTTAWGDNEALYWTYDDTTFTNCAGTCGHFTAIIWANTQSVGCGQTSGCGYGNNGVLVCNYYPGGNMNQYDASGNLIGQSPYVATSSVGTGETDTSGSSGSTSTGDSSGTSGTSTCTGIVLHDTWYSGFDGEWNYGGDHEGFYYYTRGQFFLKYLSWGGTPVYAITDSLSATSAYGRCTTTDIASCGTGMWIDWNGAVSSNTYAEACDTQPAAPGIPAPEPAPGPPACVESSGSSLSNLDGQWDYYGEENGKPVYHKEWHSYNFLLKYSAGSSTYVMMDTNGGGPYDYCSTTTSNVVGCYFDNYVGTVSAADSCSAAFENLDEGLEGELETNSNSGSESNDGWKIVLVVVIVGLLLIAAGNVAYCVYMKRVMTPKHNMAKMEKILEEEHDEIEIQCEVETSH